MLLLAAPAFADAAAGLIVPAPPGSPIEGPPVVIERVVVFADRAEVTRVITARCEGGAAAGVFVGLPEAIDPRTLRGDVDGDATAVGVSTVRTALVESLDERVRTLRADTLSANEQLAALTRAGNDDAERLGSVQSYGDYFRALAVEEMRQPKPDASRWDELLNYLESESNAALARQVARDAEIRQLTRKRERFNARLAQLAPAQAPTALTATVAVKCGSSNTPRVRLSYVVPGATWKPEYDLRFTPPKSKTGEGNAVLTVAGVVTQSSGEDWTEAELWLSTAKPALGGEAPLPNAIYVYGQPDEKTKTLVQAQEHRPDDLKAGKDTGGSVRGATLEDGGKAFVLKLPKKVTVRADGRPYWFPVDDLNTKATSTLVAVPSMSPYVFQVAAFANPASFPLMAGTVHVFRGPTFVGNDAFPYRAPGEPLEVSLGIDEEVALERKDLLKEHRDGSFFSSDKTIGHAWRTILHNRSEGDLSVDIREQIPVTKTADVAVTIESDKTSPGYTLDKVRGHLGWKVSLKRNATEQRDLAFTIALPKEWKVQ
ncbi:MAG: mucoidy inhibitor MuiA family protein [Deltaproteobacteria bacterium]|nr:mucoidy inhibitor MuiA family protein [Deltaproteobacteria bacterium]